MMFSLLEIRGTNLIMNYVFSIVFYCFSPLSQMRNFDRVYVVGDVGCLGACVRVCMRTW